jgi:hypothetical protein
MSRLEIILAKQFQKKDELAAIILISSHSKTPFWVVGDVNYIVKKNREGY